MKEKSGRTHRTWRRRGTVVSDRYLLWKGFDAGRDELVRNILSTVPVSYEEILKMKEQLDVNKATGPDGVSNWILKECTEQLADKIHSLVVTSLPQGRVPKDCNTPNTTPIFKGGNKENSQNYRPVPLTHVLGKLCERTIKKRWMEHLRRDKVLINCQFGFKRRSCSMNSLSFYSRIVNILQEKDRWVDGVYLELKK